MKTPKVVHLPNVNRLDCEPENCTHSCLECSLFEGYILGTAQHMENVQQKAEEKAAVGG